ncbi:MAG: hypothetical protein ACRC68_15750 [Clostridium sp.]
MNIAKYLDSVVRKRKISKPEFENELALTVDIQEKDIDVLYNQSVETRVKVYTQNEIDIITVLRDQVDFLKGQIEQQRFNFQEQLKLQSQSYQENLKIQLETIKSKEAIILNMQDIIKSEQENTKKILDYDERSREVDEKLSQIRRELFGRKAKNKKRLFSFLGK